MPGTHSVHFPKPIYVFRSTFLRMILSTPLWFRSLVFDITPCMSLPSNLSLHYHTIDDNDTFVVYSVSKGHIRSYFVKNYLKGIP